MLYFGLITVYSNYSRFWTTDPESHAARLCESLGADAERRVVQLSFTGCFNFSAPDVLSGQVVGVCNAAKSEENWKKLPGIWDVGRNYHHGCISGEQQKKPSHWNWFALNTWLSPGTRRWGAVELGTLLQHLPPRLEVLRHLEVRSRGPVFGRVSCWCFWDLRWIIWPPGFAHPYQVGNDGFPPRGQFRVQLIGAKKSEKPS